MRTIERCRYYAAAEAIERARTEGRSPVSVRVDGIEYEIADVDRFIERERAKMPTQLPGFLSSKPMKWLGLNAHALQHQGPDPGGGMGDAIEKKIARMHIGKWHFGEKLLALIQKDFERVSHTANVEVADHDGTSTKTTGEVVDKRLTYYLELAGASLAAAASVAALPGLPVPPGITALVFAPVAAVFVAASAVAASMFDFPIASTLLRMAAKVGLLAVVSEVDGLGMAVASAIAAFDIGAAAAMLEAPSVATMNDLHRFAPKPGGDATAGSETASGR